jgi:hypothetical protein
MAPAEQMSDQNPEQPDLVDEFYRPYIRALGNLVIMFAQCEAAVLSLVAQLCGGDELKAVDVLKAQDAKDQVISLVRSIGLSGFDLDELVISIEEFWCDKNIRNRLIHDEWYPNLFEPGTVGTRGLTRKKVPQEVFGGPTVFEVWELAARFGQYEQVFSHRSWALSRSRPTDSPD